MLRLGMTLPCPTAKCTELKLALRSETLAAQGTQHVPQENSAASHAYAHYSHHPAKKKI